jgi:hypothetical protein
MPPTWQIPVAGYGNRRIAHLYDPVLDREKTAVSICHTMYTALAHQQPAPEGTKRCKRCVKKAQGRSYP